MRYLYRGQADSAWGLSSTLYRAVKGAGPVTEQILARAEGAIVAEMRKQGLGLRMKDGELLMVLQHHAIPTRLIDFCHSGLAALFFATSDADTTDGRLFVIGQRRSQASQLQLALDREESLPWLGTARGRYARASWTASVFAVEDAPLDPRMRAQRGCFLVGGLIHRFRGENIMIGGRIQSAEVLPELTTLKVFFPLPGANKPTSDRWPAVGWTIRIPGEWKPKLRVMLAAREHDQDHMYPDFDGSRRLGDYIAYGYRT
jgi:hypothetical protein